jgi:hypothetical protein
MFGNGKKSKDKSKKVRKTRKSVDDIDGDETAPSTASKKESGAGVSKTAEVSSASWEMEESNASTSDHGSRARVASERKAAELQSEAQRKEGYEFAVKHAIEQAQSHRAFLTASSRPKKPSTQYIEDDQDIQSAVALSRKMALLKRSKETAVADDGMDDDDRGAFMAKQFTQKNIQALESASTRLESSGSSAMAIDGATTSDVAGAYITKDFRKMRDAVANDEEDLKFDEIDSDSRRADIGER